MNTPVNTKFKDQDMVLWERYKQYKSPADRSALLQRMDSLIQNTVNKWAGPVSRSTLLTEAKLLAVKAFDSYDPNRGATLATHVVTNLAPISRIVYTHQNTARLPENITLKLHTYNTAVDHLKSLHGREPTTDELHQELGWNATELNKLNTYQRSDFVESGPVVNPTAFFNTKDDVDDDILSAVYYDLLPEEKKLMEMITGFNGKKPMTNPEILKITGMTQAQLSYKKTQLTSKISRMLTKHG